MEDSGANAEELTAPHAKRQSKATRGRKNGFNTSLPFRLTKLLNFTFELNFCISDIALSQQYVAAEDFGDESNALGGHPCAARLWAALDGNGNPASRRQTAFGSRRVSVAEWRGPDPAFLPRPAGALSVDDAIADFVAASPALPIEFLRVPGSLGQPTVETGLIGGLGELRIDAGDVLFGGHQQAGQILGEVTAFRLVGENSPNCRVACRTIVGNSKSQPLLSRTHLLFLIFTNTRTFKPNYLVEME